MTDLPPDTEDSDTSSLYSVTPSIADALFRTVDGSDSHWQALNDLYIWPFDDSTPHYERLSLEFKILISRGFVPDGATGDVARLLDEAGPDGRVLDVGCGIAGLWASGMGSLFPSAEVVGLDLVPVRLERAPPNVSFEIWDVVQGIPYHDNHFDVIRGSSLAHFLPDYPSFIVECLRCLKPGGALVIAEPEGRVHAGALTIDWLSLKSPPSRPPSEPHFFDTLSKTVHSARYSSAASDSTLPSKFGQIEDKTWQIPVGGDANLAGRSRRTQRLSRIMTQITLVFLHSQMLDPKTNTTRCLSETSAELGWVERVMSGTESVVGGIPVTGGFQTVLAWKAGVGEDDPVKVKVEEDEDEDEMVVASLGKMDVKAEEMDQDL